MKAIFQKVLGAVMPFQGDRAKHHDPVVWTLAQQKKQAEKLLRADGYSRKEATTIASRMFRRTP